MLPSANAAPPSMMYHPAVHHPTHAVYSLFASIAVFMSTHAPATCHTPTTWRTGMCGMPCTIRHRCSRNRLASESSRDRHPNHRGIATRITVGSPPESQQTYVGEWTVRDIMRDEGLAASAAKRKRRLQFLRGRDIRGAQEPAARTSGEAPLPRRRAQNELWVTDVTEFRISRRLIPRAHRGLLRRHAAELVDLHVARRRDGQLVAARRVQVARRGRPSQGPLSDRGRHYCWPGWIRICDENGLGPIDVEEGL